MEKTSGFYNNSTEYSVTVMWSSIHIIYVTQVIMSLNYKLVYILRLLRLVYIYSPNHRLVYIHQLAFLGIYA